MSFKITDFNLSETHSQTGPVICLARFTLQTSGLNVPRFTLVRREEGIIGICAPVLHNSRGKVVGFMPGAYRSALEGAVDTFLAMGGKFPEDTYAPGWLEMDGDPRDWGGLFKRDVESIE